MTSGNAAYFVDANVLVYAALEGDSRHRVSKALLKDPDRGVLHLSPQNPRRVLFHGDDPSRWISLLKIAEVRGPHAFDLQIAATMLAHGLTKLVTYNGQDFKNVTEIQAAEPEPTTAAP